MKSGFLVSAVCLSLLLLGACSSPNEPGDTPASPDSPGKTNPQGETANPISPATPDGQDAPDNRQDPDSQDSPDNQADPDSQEEPDNKEAPGNKEEPVSKENQDSLPTPNNPPVPDGPNNPPTPDSPSIPDSPAVPKTLTGAKELEDYLAALPENTWNDPYAVRVGGINLASGAENALKGLYAALSRYVDLDLSDCYGEKFVSVTLKTAPNKAKIRSVILPRSLKTIDVNAFAGCTELGLADMPGVTVIFQGAFSGCAKLETLYLEELTAIKNEKSTTNGAFHQCDSLTSVSLPKVVEIGRRSFNSCDSLSTVSVPKAEMIGDNAFAGCKNLKHLILGGTPPKLGADIFANGKPERIYVPAQALDTYRNTATQGWEDDLKAKAASLP
jgi:hypothetical protein